MLLPAFQLWYLLTEVSFSIPESRLLIKKLTEKFDKCNWRKLNNSSVVALEISGTSIFLSDDLLQVYNKTRKIIDYMPTSEEGDASNLAILWSKITEKFNKETDSQFDIILQELDKLK